MAIGEDEPMSDPPPPEEPTPTKPRRRFAPQVVETTVKTNRRSPAVDPPNQDNKDNARQTVPSTARKGTMRDASVQADIEMPDAPRSPPPKRRFAPVPIETTFDSYRVSNNKVPGPTAELTPDPSPTTASPPPPEKLPQPAEETKPKLKRRFAPQLIETSRRAKREGQDGPATKHTDKTDITPGTNHIYQPKPPRKDGPRRASADQAETAPVSGDTNNTSSYLLPRRQASMKPHPNTRRGTRNNSFHPDLDTIVSDGNSSGENDDNEEEETRPAPQSGRASMMSDRSDGSTWSSRNYHLRERRESCDEDSSGYLLAVAAREALKQREMEQAMAAFPNALQLEGVEHFYIREGSEDEDPPRHGTSKLIRRKSTDPGWAVNEMRLHAEKLSTIRGQRQITRDDSFDDALLSSPPEDPYWTTNAPRPSSSAGNVIGEPTMPFIRPSPAEAVRETRMQYTKTPSSSYAIGESHMPYISSVSPANVPADVGFSNTGFSKAPFSKPFGRPFGVPDAQAGDRTLRGMRNAASPPMLGNDLKFRMCPSPKRTRIEPDHPYQSYAHLEEETHDTSEKTGLWGGYCVAKAEEPTRQENTKNKGGLWGGLCVAKDDEPARPGLQPPALLATPLPTSPADPFAMAFGMTPLSPSQFQPSSGSNSQDSTEEPPTSYTPGGAGGMWSANGRKSGVASPTKRLSAGKSRGLHLLSGLDERLKKEKARKDLEELITIEFTDAFVTQVYNYLSLGYPATARAFDEELAKISGIPICDLRQGDEEAMFELSSEGERKTASGGKVKGFMLEMKYHDDAEGKREREGCPRWKALRLYVREWARQHPDLGGDGNMIAWGVRERRGSWAI